MVQRDHVLFPSHHMFAFTEGASGDSACHEGSSVLVSRSRKAGRAVGWSGGAPESVAWEGGARRTSAVLPLLCGTVPDGCAHACLVGPRCALRASLTCHSLAQQMWEPLPCALGPCPRAARAVCPPHHVHPDPRPHPEVPFSSHSPRPPGPSFLLLLVSVPFLPSRLCNGRILGDPLLTSVVPGPLLAVTSSHGVLPKCTSSGWSWVPVSGARCPALSGFLFRWPRGCRFLFLSPR